VYAHRIILSCLLDKVDIEDISFIDTNSWVYVHLKAVLYSEDIRYKQIIENSLTVINLLDLVANLELELWLKKYDTNPSNH
jgi:hypothetical protein